MAGEVLADAAVGIAHGFISPRHRRELQHVACSIIHNVNLISISATIAFELIDRTGCKINHPFPPFPLHKDTLLSDTLPVPLKSRLPTGLH